MDIPVWFEITSLVVLTAILIGDLLLILKRPHIPSTKESALWVVFYVTLALIFAGVLFLIGDAKTSLDGLTDHDNGHPMFLALDMRDRGLVRAILTTALRYRRTIEALISARLDRALPGNAHSLSHILHVAAAQMLFLDVPDTAAVNLAVEHAKADPRTARFAALVNGVLREISRRKERALPAALAKTIDTPDWLMRRISRRIWLTSTGMMPSVGSSRMRSFGFIMRQRAMASICCSPPESVPPACFMRSLSRGKRPNT